MSQFTEKFAHAAREHAQKAAFANSGGETITYGELERASRALGAYLLKEDPAGNPVVIYGHKSPLMVVAMLACMRSGHAYVPIDVVYPLGRVENILGQLGCVPLINISAVDLSSVENSTAFIIDAAKAERIIDEFDGAGELAPEKAVSGEDAMYIMFTSGSTGEPKGVIVPARAADQFVCGGTERYGITCDDVLFNRAAFSFDMSVLDFTCGLACGATLFAFDEKADASMAMAFEALGAAHVTKWISTPSFLDACLADPAFCEALLPELDAFLIGGEVLRTVTAQRMLERFPSARLTNSYGPTEATVYMSTIDITPDVAARCNPLPVGFPLAGMVAQVRDRDSDEVLAPGEVGEICVVGPQVASGYFGRPDQTAAAFSTVELGDGEEQPLYRTGDRGYLDEDGMLFCLGRYDSQIKINGYRVEIDEVEERLSACSGVAQACVVPIERDGSIAYLCAFVILSDPDGDTSFARTRALKGELRSSLSDYMVPRTFRYVRSFPSNPNGKIDRKALAASVASRGTRRSAKDAGR